MRQPACLLPEDISENMRLVRGTVLERDVEVLGSAQFSACVLTGDPAEAKMYCWSDCCSGPLVRQPTCLLPEVISQSMCRVRGAVLEPEDAVPDCPVRSIVIEQEAVCAVDGQTGCLCPEMLRADAGPPHYLPVVMDLLACTKCCAELTQVSWTIHTDVGHMARALAELSLPHLTCVQLYYAPQVVCQAQPGEATGAAEVCRSVECHESYGRPRVRWRAACG